MPYGYLFRVAAGPRGSTHIALGFPRFGLTWGDILIAGLGRANNTAGAVRNETELWANGPPGERRRRTEVNIGACTRGGCSQGDKLMFQALRAVVATNGPLALTTDSAVFALLVPMWELSMLLPSASAVP